MCLNWRWKELLSFGNWQNCVIRFQDWTWGFERPELSVPAMTPRPSPLLLSEKENKNDKNSTNHSSVIFISIITLRSSFKAKTDFSDLSDDTKMIVRSYPATCKISSVDLFHHSMLPHNKLAPSNFSISFLILLLRRFPQSLFSEFSKLISCFLTDEYDMWW